MHHFVKDKNNLVSYNVWSCTDYDGSTNEFTPKNTITATSTTEWSINGTHSLKTTTVNDVVWNAIRIYLYDIHKNDEVTCNCTILNPDCEYLNFALIENVSGTYTNFIQVSIPPSNTPQNITLTGTVSQDISSLIITYSQSKGTVYIDNIQLTRT